MKSTKEKPSSKKALFEAVNLTKNFALVQNNDLAKQLRKHTAQLKQCTINTFFKTIYLYLQTARFSKESWNTLSVFKLIHPFYLNT